jgi:hypothetical protein
MQTNVTFTDKCPACSRRGLLRAGLAVTASAVALGGLSQPALADDEQFGRGPATPSVLPSPLPVPIPEIDAFAHHNVPAAPYAEPSQIFNFKGVVATAVLAGTGTSQSKESVRFGGPGTDLRFMSGEYVATDGTQHQGTFIRI